LTRMRDGRVKCMKLRNRIMTLGLSLSVAASMFAVPASAAGGLETQVLYGVNMRSEPTTSAKVYRMLRKGEQVVILEQVNRYWLKVEDAKGTIGYISSNQKYTKFDPDKLPKEEPAAPASPYT